MTTGNYFRNMTAKCLHDTCSQELDGVGLKIDSSNFCFCYFCLRLISFHLAIIVAICQLLFKLSEVVACKSVGIKAVGMQQERKDSWNLARLSYLKLTGKTGT